MKPGGCEHWPRAGQRLQLREQDGAEGDGVTAALPCSAGTLPRLSGGQDISPGCIPVTRGLEVVGFVEISQITLFSGTSKIIP